MAILRTEAGRDPYDRGLTDLVGELSTRSEEFRTRWAAHNVRQHYTGIKHLRHPVVGDLHLLYEALELPADDGLSLLVYTPQPGTGTDEALRLLARAARGSILSARPTRWNPRQCEERRSRQVARAIVYFSRRRWMW